MDRRSAPGQGRPRLARRRIDDDRTASVDHIRQSAHSVLALTCTAYDGEGFVGWLRAPDV